MTHLDALNLNLSNERMRLAQAKTAQERALREVWVRQLEREIAGEMEFIGKVEQPISDDELLKELGM